MLGYDRDLYMLAFDHRGSFQKQLLGISGIPTPDERARIADTKMLSIATNDLRAVDGYRTTASVAR